MADAEARIAALEAEGRQLREQQTATADVLRVIVSSPADLQPVFDAIIKSALSLSRGTWVSLGIADGTTLVIAAEAMTRDYPELPNVGQVSDLATHAPG